MGRPAEMFDDPMTDEELGALYDATALLGSFLPRPLSGFERAQRSGLTVAAGESIDHPDRPTSGPSGRRETLPVQAPMADDDSTLTGRDVLAMRADLGRKFDSSDVTGPLLRFATEYAANYRLCGRPFPDDFMGKMRAEARRPRPLSPGQAKGILNTYCAVNRDSIAHAPASAPEAPATAPAPEVAADAPTGPAEVSEGPWFGRDGLAYLVQRGKDSGALYAKPWDVDAGKFVYERGAIARVHGGRRMTIDEAMTFGQDTGTCCVCGRKLTKKASIAKGIGPVCEAGY